MVKRSKAVSVILFYLARMLLALRYRVRVVGARSIECCPRMLFLPNHPAEIDPVLLMVYLGPKFFPRPLVVEHFYRLKGFQWILDFIGVMPISTMEEKANVWRGKEVAKTFSKVHDAMVAGESFMIYPAGKLKNGGLEKVGGASFVHSLITSCKDIKVVLVRTTGLWGSSFSKAPTGQSPNFAKTLFSNGLRLLRNCIFFMPRRLVTIELELAPAHMPLQASRVEFNRFLEDWYNRYPHPGPEPLNLVSYSFFKEKYIPLPHALAVKAENEPGLDAFISPNIEAAIVNELASIAKMDRSKIERESNLSDDLGLDSLDIANFHIFLERKFSVTTFVPGELQTVNDVFLAVTGRKKSRQQLEKKLSATAFSWPKDPLRRTVRPPTAKNIQEAFLQVCDQMGSSPAIADAMLGVMSYRKLKIAVLILAEKIAVMPGDRIGVMLPASSAAYIVILAALLAKKIPVMFNWTSGVKGLDCCFAKAHTDQVITSRNFLDKAGLHQLGAIEKHLSFIEDLTMHVSMVKKTSTYLKSLRRRHYILKKLELTHISALDPAVILFTSGTESFPKAVVLSHENILFNQSSALSCVKFKRRDCLFAVLPPFHSFGFSITGLMPILAGLKVFYSPDPSDTQTMAQQIKQVRPTLFVCAPSFIRALFASAAPSDLSSLRLIVSGAEKTPQELFDYVKLNIPSAKMIEGYGITECSPVVTLCRPGELVKGVGRPLPGLELLIIDPTTHKPLPTGTPGQICIRGASVFAGYLDKSINNPFIEFGQKKWYLSGDMGRLDDKGYLYLTGRLRRFVKVGGEMVSLSGLEEEIKGFVSLKDPSLQVALSCHEVESQKPELILYATCLLDKEDLNSFLKERGWGRIIKISKIFEVEQIPLTGVGKTDYRLLDQKYLQGQL